MSETKKKTTEKSKRKTSDILLICVVVLLCVAMAILDYSDIKEKIRYSKDGVSDGLIGDTVPLILGFAAVLCLMIRGKSGLFGRPRKLLYLLPALLIAVDNFPFYAYFSGKGELLHTQAGNWLCFAAYCVFVGLFEECVFRGILFPLIAGSFSPDRKGLIKTFFISSVLFGAMHLFNIFAGGGGAAVLQAGYSTLTGGLFAYVLIKTKNVLLCALTHATYNFCGTMLAKLGGGTIFDWQTMTIMAVVAVGVGIFVLYSIWKYPEEERAELYARLGFGTRVYPKGKESVSPTERKGDD